MTKSIILVKICYNISFKVLQISLSTVVLNSRDWSEIVWLPKILHLKINLAIGLSEKNPLVRL